MHNATPASRFETTPDRATEARRSWRYARRLHVQAVEGRRLYGPPVTAGRRSLLSACLARGCADGAEARRRTRQLAEHLEQLADDAGHPHAAEPLYRAAEDVLCGALGSAHETLALHAARCGLSLELARLLSTYRWVLGLTCPVCGRVDEDGDGTIVLAGLAGGPCCGPFLAPEGV